MAGEASGGAGANRDAANPSAGRRLDESGAAGAGASTDEGVNAGAGANARVDGNASASALALNRMHREVEELQREIEAMEQQLNGSGTSNATTPSSPPPTPSPTAEDAMKDAASDNRYRDSNELLFSLRSLEKYAPWIRNVYIVTDNQVRFEPI